jgi:hypothetical protein
LLESALATNPLQNKKNQSKTREWFKKYQKTTGLAFVTAATAIIIAGIVIWKRIKDNQLAAAEAEFLREQEAQAFAKQEEEKRLKELDEAARLERLNKPLSPEELLEKRLAAFLKH